MNQLLAPDQQYAIHHGDCISHMADMPAESVDFSVYSPPYPSVYAYSSSESDIGNSEDVAREGKLHLSFFYRQIRRLMKPGRVMVVHCTQIVKMKRSGGVGMFDFRGMNIRLAERAGFIYDYDWSVRKCPQSQAIRTKSHSLQFSGLERDRANSRGAMNDYLIRFLVPGENAVPITSPNEVSRNEWIKWAEGTWTDIRETETLNGQKGKENARGPEDVRHIAPLQLEVIERLVRLYSNPGEIVFSPFGGIGSELVSALKLGRRAYGCELKLEYHREAVKNCERACRSVSRTGSLFDAFDDADAPADDAEVEDIFSAEADPVEPE